MSFNGYLKADTETDVTIGPVVAVGDGFTPVATLDPSTADEAEIIKHDGSAVTDISGLTMAAIANADGYYNLTLTAAVLDTEGRITVLFNDDSLCLPVRADFMVVNANVFDSLFAAATTDYLQADTIQVSGTSQTANDNGADINAILVDTGTTLQAELDAIQAAVITNAAGVDIAADIIALKAETALIVADTNELQSDDYPTSIAAVQTTVDAIEAGVITNAAGVDIAADIIAVKAETALIVADTNELQADDYPTSIAAVQTTVDAIEVGTITNAAGADVATDVVALDAIADAIKVITDALTAASAAKLATSAGTMVTGTVSWDNTNATTTVIYCDDITEATADHYNGRVMIFTSDDLQYQATDITDYELDTGEGKFTVTATTEPAPDNSTFIIV